MSRFTSIDCETTGFGREGRIVELAAVRYEDGRETARFHTLVNPEMPIPEKATEVNGITDEMVAGAPTAAVALPAFLVFVGSDDVVGHNIEFDLRMLHQELERLGLPMLPNEWACTMRMSRAAFALPSYRLGAVAEHLEIAVHGSHRALADALAAGAVFLRLEGR